MMGRRGSRWRHAAVVAGALLLSGCGGGAGTDGDAAEDLDVDVEVLATDDLRFEPETLEVEVGDRFALVCEPSVNHNLVIIESGEELAVCGPGGTDVATFDLDPGGYTYVCTVPGHSATMRGELTVRE